MTSEPESEEEPESGTCPESMEEPESGACDPPSEEPASAPDECVVADTTFDETRRPDQPTALTRYQYVVPALADASVYAVVFAGSVARSANPPLDCALRSTTYATSRRDASFHESAMVDETIATESWGGRRIASVAVSDWSELLLHAGNAARRATATRNASPTTERRK
jgi:hypothetical protein